MEEVNEQTNIRDCRELSAEEIDLINRIQAKGGELLQLHAELAERLSVDHEAKRCAAEAAKLALDDEIGAATSADSTVESEELRRFLAAEPQRWAAIGKNDIQTGIMALVRAVTQPNI